MDLLGRENDRLGGLATLVDQESHHQTGRTDHQELEASDLRCRQATAVLVSTENCWAATAVMPVSLPHESHHLNTIAET